MTDPMNRRQFLQAGAALAAAPMIRCPAPKSRPNILIIITDQMNIDAISAYRGHFNHPAYGSHWVNTPNLDRLVKQGVSFMQSHSTDPVCSPARSSLFTGRMPIETGVIVNNIGIDRHVPNMGEWFESQSDDYDRVYCGKWHAGGRWGYPEVSGNRKIPGFDILPVGPGTVGDLSDACAAGAGEAYIRNYRKAHPFLLTVSFLDPHDICYWIGSLRGDKVTPDRDVFSLGHRRPVLPPNHRYDFREPRRGAIQNYSEEAWKNYSHDYYRMVERLDRHVGRLLDAVDSRSDDTLIVFTSDHGEGLGRHSRVQKWHAFEQAVKVPLILSCPGRIRSGVMDTEHLVSGVDVMCTACDFAGIAAPPETCGLSLRPLLEGDASAAWRPHVFAGWLFTGHLVRSSRYKYAKYYHYSKEIEKPYLLHDGTHAPFIPGACDRFRASDIRMLFDLQNDPWETRNLAEDSRFASLLDDHEHMLKEWEARLIPGMHYDRN